MAENPGLEVVIGDLISSASSNYEVQELLGSGAYGLVTQCRKLSTNETVALKIFQSKSCIEEAKEEVQHKFCLSTSDLNNSSKTHCIYVKSLSNISYDPRRLSLKR